MVVITMNYFARIEKFFILTNLILSNFSCICCFKVTPYSCLACGNWVLKWYEHAQFSYCYGENHYAGMQKEASFRLKSKAILTSFST